MLKSSFLREMRSEQPERRIRYIWQNWGESDEAVQARIRAMMDSGELHETDEITIFRWPEPEGGWPPKDDRWSNMNKAGDASIDPTNADDQGPCPTG
jgi:hypothetical protein